MVTISGRDLARLTTFQTSLERFDLLLEETGRTTFLVWCVGWRDALGRQCHDLPAGDGRLQIQEDVDDLTGAPIPT